MSMKGLCPLNLSQSNTHPESEEQEQLSGYRLIDMNLMNDATVNVHKCKKGKLLLREDYKERHDLKSSLYVECSNCKQRTFLPTS